MTESGVLVAPTLALWAHILHTAGDGRLVLPVLALRRLTPRPGGREFRWPEGDAGTALHLALLGCGSLAIYYLGFLRPYSLSELWYRPKYTLGSITVDPAGAQLGYWLAISTLFVLYFSALMVPLRRPGASCWAVAIGVILVSNILLLLTHPFISNDVFDYAIRGRMYAFHRANPFYEYPMDYVEDPLYPYAWWRQVPSAYGPLWELLAAGIAWLAGNSVVATVLAFKMAAVAGYAVTLALVWRYLRQKAPARALHGVVLFGWNPLVLVETAGNAHNDMLMVACMVLGLSLSSRGRFGLALLALCLGTLIKFMPALLVPVLLLEALKALPGLPSRVWFLVRTGAGGILMVGAAFAPFWREGDPLGVARRTEQFATSVPSLLRGILDDAVPPDYAARLTVAIALLALGAWMAVRLRSLWHDRDPDAPARASVSILLFYLLISVPWFFQWYLLWPLAIAALVPTGPAARATLIYSLTAAWNAPMFFLFFVVAYEQPDWQFGWPEWSHTLSIVLLPLTYLALDWMGQRRRAREEPVGLGAHGDGRVVAIAPPLPTGETGGSERSRAAR